MTSEHRCIRPPAWWLGIIVTTSLTAYCVSRLALMGTAHATVLAIICATFPLMAWWEARRLRSRGYPKGADTVVIVATAALVALWGLTMYAAELAELAAGCGCPPQ
jgi:hypothetical protein